GDVQPLQPDDARSAAVGRAALDAARVRARRRARHAAAVLGVRHARRPAGGGAVQEARSAEDAPDLIHRREAPVMADPEINALLNETRVFPPTAAWRASAHAADPGIYTSAAADPEAFWAGFARELEWMTPWTTTVEWKSPHAKWFVGGTLNASVNCVDRHARTARRNKAALIWEGEPGDRRTLTYFDLYRQ